MRLIGLILTVALLTGCEPHIYDYYVIEIPMNEGVEALGRAHAHNPAVWFDDPVVTDYRLTREAYTLLGRLDFLNSHPSITIAAHGKAEETLEISPIGDGACGSFEQFGRDWDIDGYPAKRYRWRPSWNKACEADGRGPHLPEQVIRFEVRTVAGQLLATEKIAFELKSNGKYLEYDGL